MGITPELCQWTSEDRQTRDMGGHTRQGDNQAQAGRCVNGRKLAGKELGCVGVARGEGCRKDRAGWEGLVSQTQ